MNPRNPVAAIVLVLTAIVLATGLVFLIYVAIFGFGGVPAPPW